MKKKLNRPWLTSSDIERPISELKAMTKTWDHQTWSDYLDWYEVGRKDRLVSEELYTNLGESIEKNIFEEFGYDSCPRLQSLCDQLLATLPEIQQRVLRGIYFEGKTFRKIAFEINRSIGCITQIKNRAITSLKQGRDGDNLYARRIMKGADDFIPRKIESVWNDKLSAPLKDQRSFGHLNADQELLNHNCQELREIFRQLSQRSRQIIYLKFWCEQGTSEIARKLSLGLNTVEQIIDATVFKIKSKRISSINTNRRTA